MKKTLSTITVIILAAVMAVGASAQDKMISFGAKAGLNFTNMTGLKDLKNSGFLKTYTGFNIGGVMNINLPLGFEVQPELLYVQTGVKSLDVEGSMATGTKTIKPYRTGSLRLPVNVHWGFDILGVVKPYVLVSPYIGCALFQNGTYLSEKVMGEDWSRFQYGVGLGFGVKVWKIQASFKWNWELNDPFKVDYSEVIEQVKAAKFNGGEISVAFLF
ncbi:MAG: PorT family protein [Bacteroidales bacterium]|nr:PorT family protein [Bacteroidales bacterium]